MKIKRVAGQGVQFSNVSQDQLHLFEQIPLHADPTASPEAEARLFPGVVRRPESGEHEQLNNDWEEYVEPELRSRFSGDVDCVTATLKKARVSSSPDGPVFEFTILQADADAWYSALNQARLVMHVRYHFPDEETPEEMLALLESENVKPWITSRFYMQMQSILLDLAMNDWQQADEPAQPELNLFPEEVWDEEDGWDEDEEEGDDGGDDEPGEDGEKPAGDGPKWV